MIMIEFHTWINLEFKFFFFFSSRRRHTRSKRDWSSDVCSSDLAYGAGLYAMAGPAFDSDAVIALPSAQIAVMGPEPAINAVFYNKLAELPEDQRAARRKELED